MLPYVAFDSAPFTNGDLHVGHARNYVLGDVDARFHRLEGFDVIYTTNFDAYGWPILERAQAEGVDPHTFSRRVAARMTEDFQRLRLSYDYARIRSTNDASMMRSTQRLFQLLVQHGRAHWHADEKVWITPMDARTGLDGAATLAALPEWSQRAKNILAGHGRELGPWRVSRPCPYGTPVPMVLCDGCGPVAIPDDLLPWTAPVPMTCPSCGVRTAEPDPNTLDCVLDDLWCFVAWDPEAEPFAAPGQRAGAPGAPLAGIDIFHGGYDTWIYPLLYLGLARFLHEVGLMTSPVPMRRYHGHDMVLMSTTKMGKSLGNAVTVRSVLENHSVEALRLGLLLAAAPSKPIPWSEDILQRGAWAAEVVASARKPARGQAQEASPEYGAATSISGRWKLIEKQATAFLRAYRPHAALEVLLSAVRQSSGASTGSRPSAIPRRIQDLLGIFTGDASSTSTPPETAPDPAPE